MGWGCAWSRRLSVIEELRGNRCSPARADSRSSSVAPDEGGKNTDHLVVWSQLMKSEPAMYMRSTAAS